MVAGPSRVWPWARRQAGRLLKPACLLHTVAVLPAGVACSPAAPLHTHTLNEAARPHRLLQHGSRLSRPRACSPARLSPRGCLKTCRCAPTSLQRRWQMGCAPQACCPTEPSRGSALLQTAALCCALLRPLRPAAPRCAPLPRYGLVPLGPDFYPLTSSCKRPSARAWVVQLPGCCVYFSSDPHLTALACACLMCNVASPIQPGSVVAALVDLRFFYAALFLPSSCLAVLIKSGRAYHFVLHCSAPDECNERSQTKKFACCLLSGGCQLGGSCGCTAHARHQK